VVAQQAERIAFAQAEGGVEVADAETGERAALGHVGGLQDHDAFDLAAGLVPDRQFDAVAGRPGLRMRGRRQGGGEQHQQGQGAAGHGLGRTAFGRSSSCYGSIEAQASRFMLL